MYIHMCDSLELFHTFVLSQQFVLFVLLVWEMQRTAKREQYYPFFNKIYLLG